VFGQAAGTAAAMAAKTGIAPKEVNVQELREKIKTQGAYLGE